MAYELSLHMRNTVSLLLRLWNKTREARSVALSLPNSILRETPKPECKVSSIFFIRAIPLHSPHLTQNPHLRPSQLGEPLSYYWSLCQPQPKYSRIAKTA